MNVLQTSWTPAAIRRLAATLLAGCLLLPAVASANLITNGDFESAGITTNSDFLVNDTNTYGKWLDVLQWQRVCESGNCFAKHVSTGNNNNLLFQGFSATGLAAGTVLNISFDYAFAAGGLRNLRIYGLNAGGTLDNNAPWGVTNGSLLRTTQLAIASSLTAYSTTFTLPDVYSALVIGFEFSSSGIAENWPALRAVDNVVVTASVPAPAPLALFGLGLFLVGLSRTLRTRTRQLS